ncbi:centromere protein P [Hippocampus comes]|uniref:Centromere protein P n=1 Tax=Hippocampus comes TaxID=109280 RepID=A0A3Q3DYQ2_HIPCM|nr:PREDICTED: centromere protein P [Hippocampus comes]XP_019716038.1 PREDICTED: centromere protein P [Hippocampus comes]
MEGKLNEENMEEVMLLEENIRRLQAEVAELQGQCQKHQKELTLHSSQSMKRALSLVCGHTLQEDTHVVLSSLREEVEQLEDDLERQSNINGISLRSFTACTLESSDTKSVQQMCVSGQCSDLKFQVEFELSEVKGDERPEKSITSFNVVMGAGDLQNFSSFLSGVEESKDILLFFRTLRTFSDRMDERRRAFQHFQTKYGHVVCAPGDNSSLLTFHHPDLPGCIFLVHWSVDVSKEGEVTPKVDLLTKIPDRALQLFQSQAVVGTAEAFHSLLRLLGPEAALEEVIRAAGLITD